MKKLVIFLFVIVYSITSFAQSVYEVKQILIGEWYEDSPNETGCIKFNANGTGSLIIYAFLYEESLADFTWMLTDENTLVYVLPDNEISRESISIIDHNTILLNGSKYIRRISKEASITNSSKPTKNVTKRDNSSNNQSTKRNLNVSQHAPVVKTTNSIVIKHVNNSDDFSVMYKNLIVFPFDFRNSNISDIINYCNSNGYTFSGEDYDNFRLIQVSNPVTEIFGLIFEVRIQESDGFIYDKNHNHIRMSLEWYSKRYSSIEKMNSDFKKFTVEIEKAGGVFKGYDETCHRSIYIFPNGVEIKTKAWVDSKYIQMYVDLP